MDETKKQQLVEALRHGLQAASNGVANSTLGQPVDTIANWLRYLGVPVGDAPVGGQQWLQNHGFTVPVPDTNAAFIGNVLGETAGGLMLNPVKVPK